MAFVFGDISGGDGDTVIAAACYLGDETQWGAAVPAWVNLVKEAGVSCFHATDFFNARGEFDSDEWRHQVNGRLIPGGPKYDDFAKRFAAVADDAELIGFAWAADQEAFRSILAPELLNTRRRHPSGDARVYAAMGALTSVSEFLDRAKHRRLRGVLAAFEHEQGAGRFETFFEESTERREEWTRWFSGFKTVPKQFEPVQIADLLAHEAWRRAKEILKETEGQTPRRMRKSFERMLLRKRVELRWHGRDHAIRNAEQTRDILSRYPDGLVVPNGG